MNLLNISNANRILFVFLVFLLHFNSKLMPKVKSQQWIELLYLDSLTPVNDSVALRLINLFNDHIFTMTPSNSPSFLHFTIIFLRFSSSSSVSLNVHHFQCFSSKTFVWSSFINSNGFPISTRYFSHMYAQNSQYFFLVHNLRIFARFEFVLIGF